ncbi:MAG TPA: type IV secretion system DNA-binding domain-containing protein [Patescibacteria group bacterium]|nr:type IV secretion system DNA-binding domain-containing protein [Patescibacteria group bacterium]
MESISNGFSFSDILFGAFRIIFYLLIIGGWIFGFSLIIKAYSKRRKRLWLVKQKYTTLLIKVPRANEKGPLSAQMMFASLHGIHKSTKEKLEEGSFQEHISFEIVSSDKYLRFYVYVPVHLVDFVQGQIYAQYPTVEISEVEDYTLVKRPEGIHFVGTELILNRNSFYPIKSFQNFEVDPLASITGVISQLNEGEQIWIQILTRPVDDLWQQSAMKYVSDIKSGKKPDSKFTFTGMGIIKKLFSIVFLFFKLLASPEALSKGSKDFKLPGPVEQAVKAIEEKSTKLGYETKIRLTFLSNKSSEELKIKMQSIVGAFKQFNASNLNGFAAKGLYFDDFEYLNAVQARHFEESGFIFNIEELASLFHLPTVTVETPTIDWAGSKKGEPPATLPLEGVVDSQDLTVFGKVNFRDKDMNFGIKMDDRRRHMYIIGQTGTGKTTVMKNMVLDDIDEGRGLAIIDPHGEFVDTALDYIPEKRINDVVYLNPGDREYSLGFNLLENVDVHKREILASGMMSIFKKIWEGVWSARMEYIMKNIILALMETPGTTMLSATKMLTNTGYRKMIVDNIADPVVKAFWTDEYEVQLKTNPRFATEAIAPIQNKIGQFLSVPSIRNIVGQPQSTFDIKDIMDNQKILLVKISKGEIGEDNMALLGAMIITKIQLTAMERSTMREEDMKDFYLYVDEFQNFATTSFATILAEARKYKLNLIMAHQYVAQMDPEIRDAVFGNVGNTIAFRVSVDDAPVFKKTFEPVFDEVDLVNLSNRHIYVKMTIDGAVNPAFSATTVYFKDIRKFQGLGDRIIAESRAKYAVPRADVEQAILTWSAQMAELEGKKKDFGDKKGFGKLIDAESLPEVTEKPGEKFREIKDKVGGIWYAKKKAEKNLESGITNLEEKQGKGEKEEIKEEIKEIPQEKTETKPVQQVQNLMESGGVVVNTEPADKKPNEEELAKDFGSIEIMKKDSNEDQGTVVVNTQVPQPEEEDKKDENVIHPGGSIQLH